jgi:hypothetical protein
MRYVFVSTARFAAVAVAFSFLVGCALLDSSTSISDSVSSPFKWSSSSSSGEDFAMYREDVERLTVAHLRAGGDAPALRGSIAGLARKQGITDWAADQPTLEGVDAGLRAAGLDDDARSAYAARLLGDDADALFRLAEHPAR